MFEPFISFVSVASVVLVVSMYLMLCYASWRFLIGCSNAAKEDSKSVLGFESFAEEVKCFLPDGHKYRLAFVKRNYQNIPEALKRQFAPCADDEVQEASRYDNLFYRSYCSRFRFWSSEVMVFLLSPLFFVVAAVLLPFVVERSLWHKYMTFDWLMTQRPNKSQGPSNT